MRIKSVRLRNYKRFTDLTIADIPAAARLVVLVGPNGTGKSSVFDSFLLKASGGRYQLRPLPVTGSSTTTRVTPNPGTPTRSRNG